MATQERVYYYHADASAFGGHSKIPLEKPVEIQAPISLSPSGGYGSARVDNKFHFAELASFERAYTQVSGTVDHDTGNWKTLATSTVEGLNILDVVTADRVVAELASEYPRPAGQYVPKVSILGSRIENLKIKGVPVEVVVDPDFLAAEGTSSPLVNNQSFLQKVEQQHRQMADPEALPPWVVNRVIPEWIPIRFPTANFANICSQRGVVLCSLVKQTNGQFHGAPYGNVLEIPDFGKIFLGEVLFDRNTFRVIMLRAELGSPVTADFTAAHSSVEGHGHP